MKIGILSWILTGCVIIGGVGCSAESADPDSPDPGPSGEQTRAPIGKADSLSGSCSAGDVCGGQSNGSCWCDDQCSKYGDCCSDYAQACGGESGCTSNSQCGDGKTCTDGECAIVEGRCASAADCADGEQCIAPACEPGGPCAAGYCVGPASITFDDQWNETVSGKLVAGAKVEIHYDADRLTECRGDQGGNPAWTIYGSYSLNGAEKSFWVAGHSPDGQTKTPSIVLPEAGELRMWFENTSIWGCIGYDSNLGADYRFDVAPLGG